MRSCVIVFYAMIKLYFAMSCGRITRGGPEDVHREVEAELNAIEDDVESIDEEDQCRLWIEEC